MTKSEKKVEDKIARGGEDGLRMREKDKGTRVRGGRP